MDSQIFVGSRIRQRRIDQGLRQADVAASAGISASYLNLIEHNKRRIGGRLLATLAEILSSTPETLSAGGDAAVLDGLYAAVSRFGQPVEIDRAEDIAVRYPGWAGLIAGQEARIATLEREIQALSDRMGHDPALAEALHEVISSVTAIRATSGILVSGERLDEDWQSRFHANLYADSQRLTEQSKSLVAYLDQPEKPQDAEGPQNVLEQVEHFLTRNPDLIRAFDDTVPATVDALMSRDPVAALPNDVRTFLRGRLQQHAEDAEKLPLSATMDAAIASDVDPSALAARFQAPLPQVFRRLAFLPDDTRLPPRGLVVCDMAGVITCLKPTAGLRVNRHTNNCPLWPLFTALRQVEQPVRHEVVLPGAAEPRFLCYAQATSVGASSFDAPMRVESTMLVVVDPRPGQAPEIKAGASCRICTRMNCGARREPALVGGNG